MTLCGNRDLINNSLEVAKQTRKGREPSEAEERELSTGPGTSCVCITISLRERSVEILNYLLEQSEGARACKDLLGVPCR